MKTSEARHARFDMPITRRGLLPHDGKPDRPTGEANRRRQVEIVSLLVSAQPQHLAAVAAAILDLGNCEIHAQDPKGKLIVVIEEESQGAIGAKANLIAGLPHVVAAAMVFQATDTDPGIA
jgi:periplasmic nitrate reductase NapD